MIDLVARKTVLATESLCFAANYFTFLVDAFNEVKESEVMAHADELETSLYLHLAADRVKMDKAAPDNDRMGKYCSSDSTGTVRFNDSGEMDRPRGPRQPTPATAEKARSSSTRSLEGLVELYDIHGWPIEKRRDQHTGPVQKGIRW